MGLTHFAGPDRRVFLCASSVCPVVSLYSRWQIRSPVAILELLERNVRSNGVSVSNPCSD